LSSRKEIDKKYDPVPPGITSSGTGPQKLSSLTALIVISTEALFRYLIHIAKQDPYLLRKYGRLAQLVSAFP